jgi:hypothetical protein
MAKNKKASRVWVKPQITRLGDLKDVAGGASGAGQSTKS